MKTKLYKIKPDKKEAWLAWGRELMTTHKEAAMKTLKDEKVMLEFFVAFEIGGNSYTLGGYIGPDEVHPDPNHMLNKQHRAMKHECLEPCAKGELVYLLEAN